MSETFETFRPAELNSVIFTCPKCKTEIVFELEPSKEFSVPHLCPTCHEQYIELAKFLESYRELWNRASKLGDAVRFRAARSAKNENGAAD